MVVIRSIETAVPPTVIDQDRMRDLFASQPGYGRLGRRLIAAAFDGSAIETRHVVLEEFAVGATESAEKSAPADAAAPVFFDAATGLIGTPSTRARNDAYIAHAQPLLLEAGRAALRSAGVAASEVTHVVTVSCTGFFAPGPDYVLVRGLDLEPGTQRYHLGFMGCYGAFPALRMAEQFCRADERAVVLVVCVELCSLHVHTDDDPDTIVASSVFADGAAAAVVTSSSWQASPAGDGGRAPQQSATLELDAFSTAVVPEGEGDMAWTIGDHGFDMTLSTYVPRIVERSIAEALAPVLAGRDARDVERWAVHPGGRSILDRVQSTLGLSDEQMSASRETLRQNGNMSSATVLFVLKRLLEGGREAPGSRTPERVCAVAFGPGLTVESAMMTLHPAPLTRPVRPAAAEPVRA